MISFKPFAIPFVILLAVKISKSFWKMKKKKPYLRKIKEVEQNVYLLNYKYSH